MKTLFFCLILFFTISSISQNLQKHQWKNRVLLIYADDVNSNQLQEQIKILAEDKKGLQERKLVIYQFVKDKFTTDFNTVWFSSKEQLKQYHKKSNRFEVLLIGLDGGLKYRQTKLVSLEKLFTLIDGMPMRKRELKN